MKCPVPCHSCGDIIELDAAHFHIVDYCDCLIVDSCDHGICDDCLESLYDDEDDE